MKKGMLVEEAEVRVRQAAKLLAIGALRAVVKQEERRYEQGEDRDYERESAGLVCRI